MSTVYFLGIDVGTGSARAGVFDVAGTLLGSAKNDIKLFRNGPHVAEQSSDDIWDCVCASVKSAIKNSSVPASAIKGIGFDATCSLVVLNGDSQPVSISESGDDNRNIIVWMDHRATEQARRINASEHRVLKFVGGSISPEMQTPKLLWLKENMESTYHSASHFFDLTDFLTWRATGDNARSICTVTCKWTYMSYENSWDATYFDAIGLGDLAKNNFERIGSKVVDTGTPLGNGLTAKSAAELGLEIGTPVAAGLIDAHAGGVGTIGAAGDDATSRMAYVFGTSACTMSSSKNQSFVPGVWGPYYSAMVPGLWLNEGGQSAAGEAIAHLLKLHPAYGPTTTIAKQQGHSLPDYLLGLIEDKVEAPSEAVKLAGQIVIVPEFLGNRAPFADPNARGIIAGLDLNTDIDSLIGLYIAGVCGLGYGLKQILDAQRENGVTPQTVIISGGAGESAIVKQLLADSASINIASPKTDEPVLLGSAMLGAVAAGVYEKVTDAMSSMSSVGDTYAPSENSALNHAMRFEAYKALQAAGHRLKKIDYV